MTRVDFYLLAPGSRHDLITTACKLIEKALASRQRVHIHTDDHELAKKLDQALWSYKPDSFIPHVILENPAHADDIAPADLNTIPGVTSNAVNETSPSTTQQPPFIDIAGLASSNKPSDSEAVQVTIGTGLMPPECGGVLMNLSEQVPAFFSRFGRTLEIVASDDAARKSSRDRYRFYQQRGYPLNHHNLA